MTLKSRIFPITPGQRTPPLVKWRSQPLAAKYDWAGKYKTANIGFAIPRHILVFDVDQKHGAKGAQSLRALIADGMIRKTYTIKTPSGGLHMYYALPANYIANTTIRILGTCGLFPGIDIRVEGNFVLTPPSTLAEFDDRPYKVIPGTGSFDHLTEIHPDLFAALKLQTIDPNVSTSASRSLTTPDQRIPTPPKYAQTTSDLASPTLSLTHYDINHAKSKIPRKIHLGERDSTCHSLAASWRGQSIPIEIGNLLMVEAHKHIMQTNTDPFHLVTAQEKLVRVYDEYPSGEEEWEAHNSLEPIEPTKPLPSARGAGLPPSESAPKPPETIQDLLGRYTLCVAGPQVIDSQVSQREGGITLNEFHSEFAMLKMKMPNSKKYQPTTKAWVEHINRRTVKQFGYKPRADQIFVEGHRDTYNLWTEPSLVVPEVADPAAYQPFYDHLDYLFGADAKEKKLFLQWLVFAITHPELRASYAVLIIGKPGIGKSWFHALLSVMVGDDEVSSVTSTELMSEFNSWVYAKSFVVSHELLMTQAARGMEQLKNLITEPTTMINEKGIKRQTRRIYAAFLCFSNYSSAVQIADDDRKFFIYRSQAEKKSDLAAKEMFNWLHSDGPAHLLQHFRSMDLSSYNPYAAPMVTAAKRAMVQTNMSDVEQLIRDAHQDGVYPFNCDITDNSRVAAWVCAATGADTLNTKAQHKLKIVLAELSPIALPQTKYSIPAKGQRRLKAIRHGDRWSQATADEVVAEYLRAEDSTARLPTDKLDLKLV